MNPLLGQFLTEGRELLEQIGERLLALEKTPDDAALIDGLFRSVHTLKGNSGLFKFQPLTRVVHAAEDLLDRVREGELKIDPALVDELLSAMDFVLGLLDRIEQTEALAPEDGGEVDAVVSRLRARLPEKAAAVADAAVQGVPPPADLSWLLRLDEATRAAALLAASHQGALTAVRYLPEPGCFFKGEDPLLVLRNLPERAGFSIQAAAPWPPAAALDVFRCNLLIDALSLASPEVVAEHFRYVPEQVAIYQVPAAALAVTSAAEFKSAASPAPPAPATGSQSEAAPGGRALAADDEAMWQKILAIQRRLLDLPVPPAQWAGRLAALHNTLSNLFQARADTAMLARLEVAAGAALAERSFTPLATLLDADARPAPTPTPAPASRPPDAAPEVTPHLAARPEAAQPEPVHHPEGVHAAPEALKFGRRAEDLGGDKGARVLKVPQEKVDRLMDLIGEMVVAKNALPYLAARAEEFFGSRELSREIKAQYAVINRIAEEMQDGIMQVRMLPVGAVFQRFPRLVRDVAKSLGKKVRLDVEGEETEADKNIVEALGDPLIHILRNSLDHGIELPAVRAAAGKPEEGVLTVRARHEGDRVLIDIVDDGKGIDPAIVKRKAFEKGLIDEQRLETMTDAEAVQLVFAAGFSTAEIVSDLSGRGVGMDVVKTSLQKIGGQVALSSEKGVGTRITLTLPLSMAVSNVMMIEAGGQRFGVPLEFVVETVRIHEKDLHVLKNRRTAVLRGQLVPLFGADELLKLPTPPRANAEGELAVLVSRVGGETVGVVVDGFAQTIDVILKPLEGALAGLPGFGGTALLGDGSVLLVLDLKELI